MSAPTWQPQLPQKYGVSAIFLTPGFSDRVQEPLLKTAAQTGGQITYLPCDVTNEQSVEKVFAEAESASRYPIRGLVTLAGISGRCPAVEYPVDAFRKIMDVNVTGTFLCARTAARIFHRLGVAGSIVMFASMSATNVNQVSQRHRKPCHIAEP